MQPGRLAMSNTCSHLCEKLMELRQREVTECKVAIVQAKNS